MIELGVRIETLNEKLSSIETKTSTELQDDLNKLQQCKEEQMGLLNEMKNNEIDTVTNRYQQQIKNIDQQRTQQISSFKTYCIKELQRLKKDIRNNGEAIDIDLNGIYHKWRRKHSKDLHNNNQRITRHTRTRSLTNINRTFFPPQSCLEHDDIVMDLQLLVNKAKEQNIEIPDNFVPKKTKARKYKTGVTINEDDRIQIENICNKIGINLLDKQLSVALYGYKQHLEVYKDIFDWIHGHSVSQQSEIINELKSGKLRDLQVKLASAGTVGRKNEMANGIRIKLKQLTAKYKAK